MSDRIGGERNLRGRRALVTGGGSGLGFIFADALAEAGADVAICGRRADVIHDAAGKLARHGVQACGHAVDISRPEEITRLHELVGEVDILVNNAGYSIRKNSWLEVTASEWQEVLAINLMAPFLLSQRFAPGMMERGFGRIVNLSSIYGVVASNPEHYPDMASDNTSYAASKHALIGLTKNLAMRVAGKGVTVNTLSPGIFPGNTRVERTDGAVPGAQTAKMLLSQIPTKRFGTGADLRGVITFIASDDSAYITGHSFVVDGGFTIS